MLVARKDFKDVLDGIVNQLDNNDKAELLRKVLDITTFKQKRDILEYCQVNFPIDYRISLEENGIIQVD